MGKTMANTNAAEAVVTLEDLEAVVTLEDLEAEMTLEDPEAVKTQVAVLVLEDQC